MGTVYQGMIRGDGGIPFYEIISVIVMSGTDAVFSGKEFDEFICKRQGYDISELKFKTLMRMGGAMTNWKEISAGQTYEKWETEEVVIIDIRDADSFDASHIPESIHLDKGNSKEFIDSADKDIPVIVYCYHGNNSKSAASFLLSEGFKEVYSMAGGFESWRNTFPCEP